MVLRLRSFGERRSVGSLCAGCSQPGCFVAAGSAGQGILLQHPSQWLGEGNKWSCEVNRGYQGSAPEVPARC